MINILKIPSEMAANMASEAGSEALAVSAGTFAQEKEPENCSTMETI